LRINSTPNLEANKAYKGPKSKGGKQAYCKHCKSKGHLEEKCWQKYPELRPYNAKKDTKPNKAKGKQQGTNSKQQGTDKGLMLAFTLSKSLKLTKLSNLSLKSKMKSDLSTKLENLPNLGLAISKPNNKIIIDLGTSKHYLLNKD